MVPTPIAKVIEWLRAGYPQGVPRQDYVALLGILHRSLTDAEVATIAEELRLGEAGADGTITSADIAGGIQETVKQQASEADIARVASHLAAGGWPLMTIASSGEQANVRTDGD